MVEQFVTKKSYQNEKSSCTNSKKYYIIIIMIQNTGN